MAWNDALIAFRDVLASIYPARADIVRIVDMAEIRREHVAFDPKAVNTWHSIVFDAAMLGNRLDALIRVVSAEFRDHTELHTAMEAIKQWENEVDIGIGPPQLYKVLRNIDHPGTDTVLDRLHNLSESHRALVEWKELHNMLDDLGAVLGQFSTFVSNLLGDERLGKPDELADLWRPVRVKINGLLDWSAEFQYIERVDWFRELSSLQDGIAEILVGTISVPGPENALLRRLVGRRSEQPWLVDLSNRTRLLEDRIKEQMSYVDKKLRSKAEDLSRSIGVGAD